MKAGHIAVLIRLLDGEEIPSGKSQIAHASAMVKQRFGEASVLFAMDQLIKGVLRAVTAIIRGIATFLPIPGLQQMTGVLRPFSIYRSGSSTRLSLPMPFAPDQPTHGSRPVAGWCFTGKTISRCYRMPLG